MSTSSSGCVQAILSIGIWWEGSLAIGLLLSPIMANVYKDYFEEFAIELSLVKSSILLRYLGAGRYTNSVGPCELNKTFQMVHKAEELAFLDVLIIHTARGV